MKFTGWNMFLALLIANVMGAILTMLNMETKVIWIVGIIVFAIMAVVLAVASSRSAKFRQREAAAAAKIAELQDQMAERDKNGTAL